MEKNSKESITQDLKKLKNLAESLNDKKRSQETEKKLVEMITNILIQYASDNLREVLEDNNFVLKSLKPKSGLYIEYVSRQIARMLSGQNEFLIIYLHAKYSDEKSCDKFLDELFVLLKKFNITPSFTKKESVYIPCSIVLKHT